MDIFPGQLTLTYSPDNDRCCTIRPVAARPGTVYAHGAPALGPWSPSMRGGGAGCE